MAALAKSWCFEEATLGVAALNAWYGREENLRAMGAVIEGDGVDAEETATSWIPAASVSPAPPASPSAVP